MKKVKDNSLFKTVDLEFTEEIETCKTVPCKSFKIANYNNKQQHQLIVTALNKSESVTLTIDVGILVIFEFVNIYLGGEKFIEVDKRIKINCIMQHNVIIVHSILPKGIPGNSKCTWKLLKILETTSEIFSKCEDLNDPGCNGNFPICKLFTIQNVVEEYDYYFELRLLSDQSFEGDARIFSKLIFCNLFNLFRKYIKFVVFLYSIFSF